jgi:uncharacterized protein (UPF0248 family)
MTKRMAILLAAAGLLMGGCGMFEDPTPQQARLVIEGEAGKQVRLIVSTKFVAAVNEEGQTRVVIFQSDTLLTTLPHHRIVSIREDQRFFVEAARSETDLQALRMEVYVDSRKQYDEDGPLVANQPFRFVYSFNQAVTRIIEVI